MGPFKISTFVFLLVVFLIGEYAVVTFGPYPPGRRKQLVMQLPVIKQVLLWKQEGMVRDAFAELDGPLSWTGKDTTYTWTDADELIAALRGGSWDAAMALNKLTMNQRFREAYPETQRKARQGDLYAMGDYLFFAGKQGEREDSTEAASMLRNHPSASARWALAARTRRADRTSRESQLLLAEVARENLRRPGMKDSDYAQLSASNRNFLESLQLRATEGDTDAQWVLEQLAIRPVWQPAAQ